MCDLSDSYSDSVSVSAVTESDANGVILFSMDGSASKSGSSSADVCPNIFTSSDQDSWSVDLEGSAPALTGLLGSLAVTPEFDFAFSGSLTMSTWDDGSGGVETNSQSSSGTLLVGSMGRPWEVFWTWPRSWGTDWLGNPTGCSQEGNGTLTVTRRETAGGPVIDEMHLLFTGTACDNCGDLLLNGTAAGTYCR